MSPSKNKCVLYYVEGDDEMKLVNTLKTELGMIEPGKVQKLNVVQTEITAMHLRTLKNKTIIVLIFDTDTDSVAILNKNIRKLQSCQAVSEIILIPQVPNLEGELVRSCNIRKIEELLNSKSKTDFKADFIRVSNLGKKLQEHNFDICLFWSQIPSAPFHGIENNAAKIKKSSNK